VGIRVKAFLDREKIFIVFIFVPLAETAPNFLQKKLKGLANFRFA
jgi:hypothetical protein